MNGENPFNQGYRTAYLEIYSALNDPKHQDECGECRPCGVAKELIEILMETLAKKLTQEEFFTLSFGNYILDYPLPRRYPTTR